jgi:hypothetical protein
MREEPAALRNFNPAYVGFGSFATGQCPRDVRYTSDRYQFPASQRNDAMCQEARLSATLAYIEELAGIGRHPLGRLMPTSKASQRGFDLH